MIDPRMSRFWRLALQSDLIDDRGLSDCWESIPPERRDSIEQIDRRLARQAIQLNYITLWQAQQLLAGRFHGFKVGRYILLNLIGQGGMGRVYLAKDTRLGRTVALKILSADRMKNPRAIARFQREAKVGAQLQHENLVRMYDFGESEGRHYLVMEYIEGRTIGSLIAQQGPIPPGISAGLGRQIALGLEHAYKKGLVHRDVNPYNILVMYDGTAKLADLGLALDLSDNDRFTRDGATVGTFDYVSPEQARHSNSVDIRSDIYSLGCTIYHMIAGEVPYPTASLAEKLFAHQSVEPIPLRQIVPALPEGLANGIAKMMQKSPDERFSTPLQVAQMLEPFLDGSPRKNPRSLIQESREDRSPGQEAQTRMIPRYATSSNWDFAKQQNGYSERKTTEFVSPANRTELPIPPVPIQQDAITPSKPAPGTLSDIDLPLMLDLGPEPSLSEVLAESRTLPSSRVSPSSSSGVRLTKQWHVNFWSHVKSVFTSSRLAVVLLLVVAALSGFFAISLKVHSSRSLAEAKPVAQKPPITNPDIDNTQHDTVTLRDMLTERAEATSSSSEDAASILVRSFDRKSPDIPANSLSEAINRAIGSRGMVVLRNQKPLEFSNTKAIQMNLPGKLLICAEKGVEPVLNVTLNGPGPFLRSGSSFSLDLEGLTIRAKLPSPPLRFQGFPRSAIIQAAGSLNLSRCDIKVLENSEKTTSVAVFSDGGSLTVERCRFEGFDRAIEIQMYRQYAASMRQIIVVPAVDGSATKQSWGIKISHVTLKDSPADPDGLQIKVDHSSFRGSGFLELAGFSERTPLQVGLSNCDIQTEALIKWDPTSGDPNCSKRSFQWTGHENHYDIQGKSWVVYSPAPSGTAEANPRSIIDAKSWAKEMAELPPSTNSTVGADTTLVGPSSPGSK